MVSTEYLIEFIIFESTISTKSLVTKVTFICHLPLYFFRSTTSKRWPVANPAPSASEWPTIAASTKPLRQPITISRMDRFHAAIAITIIAVAMSTRGAPPFRTKPQPKALTSCLPPSAAPAAAAVAAIAQIAPVPARVPPPVRVPVAPVRVAAFGAPQKITRWRGCHQEIGMPACSSCRLASWPYPSCLPAIFCSTWDL